MRSVLVTGIGAPRPVLPDVRSMFAHAAATQPDTVALVHLGRRLTYADASRGVARIASQLLARGLAGKVVALVLPNSIEHVIAYYGCLAAGAIPALMNPTFPSEAMRPLIQASEPAAAFVLPDQAEKVSELGTVFRFETLVIGAGALSVEVLTALHAAPADGDAPDPDSPAVILFSGGTTGLPKAVVHTHRRLMAKIERIEWAWPTRESGEVWLPVAPFFHVYGMLMGLLNPVYGRATLVIPARFQPDLVIGMLADHRVTVFGGGPPAVYGALLASSGFDAVDLSALRVCPGGGASFPVELLRRWEAATGRAIHEGYGMTEVAPIAVNTLVAGRREGSVGKAVPGTVVEIVDLESGDRVMPIGEPGEIRIRGPHMFEGYLGRPEETAVTLKGGYVYTGDIGTLDAEGFLTITDRKKDVIFVNGFNVFPREIEEVLIAHPSVRTVGVARAPDPRTGEKAVAFVVAGAGVDSDSLSAWCRERLAPYKVPGDILFVDELPLTPAGKLDRMALARAAVAPSS
jgi:long-chain acyl-CoA synthetase